MKINNIYGRICLGGVIAVIFLVWGCTHRYVGKEVDMNASMWCVCDGFPKSCSTGDESEAFLIDFTVSRGDADGEYIVEGSLDGSRGPVKSASAIVPRHCRFGLLLVKDGVIIDYVSFSPETNDLSRKATLKKTFHSEPFDAVTISYDVLVKG